MQSYKNMWIFPAYNKSNSKRDTSMAAQMSCCLTHISGSVCACATWSAKEQAWGMLSMCSEHSITLLSSGLEALVIKKTSSSTPTIVSNAKTVAQCSGSQIWRKYSHNGHQSQHSTFCTLISLAEEVAFSMAWHFVQQKYFMCMRMYLHVLNN